MFVIIVETVLEFVISARNEGPPIKRGVIYGCRIPEVGRSNIYCCHHVPAPYFPDRERDESSFICLSSSFFLLRASSELRWEEKSAL